MCDECANGEEASKKGLETRADSKVRLIEKEKEKYVLGVVMGCCGAWMVAG